MKLHQIIIAILLNTIFVLPSGKINAQEVLADSIVIEAQSIVRSGTKSLTGDYKLDLLDFTDLIGAQAGNYSRNYGPGQSATAALLGSTSAQVNFVWEGLVINNPMLGSGDLSLIPSFFFENSYINYMPLGNMSGIGGNILLQQAKQDIQIQARLDVGQFDKYGLATSFNLGQKDYKHTIKIQAEKASNQYERIINGIPWRINRAASKQLNLHYGSATKLKKISWNQSLWITMMEREIPAGGNTESFSLQTDRNIRYQSSFKKSFTNAIGKLQIGYLQDRIDFKNDFINETGLVHQLISNIEWKRQFNNSFFASSKILNIAAIASHQNYEKGKQINNNLSWDNHIEFRKKYQKASLGLLTNFQKRIYLDPYLNYSITKKSYKIGVSGSIVSRFPSLNDLFWVPGGNESLIPERAWKLFLHTSYEKKRLIIEGNLFYRYTTDMIQWQPQSSGVWTPQNIGLVRSYGIIAKANYAFVKKEELGLKLYLDYQWSPSIIADPSNVHFGNQLIYLPIHQSNTLLSFRYKSWGVRGHSHYYSERFTNQANEFELPGYWKNDVILSKEIDYKKLDFSFFAGIYNIGNALFQSSAGYYQPGRNFKITIETTIK